MIPLWGSVMELFLIRDESDQILAEVRERTGVDQAIPIGTMIELPRAALTATRVAQAAEFFSFRTDDLTQTTWGFSGTTSRPPSSRSTSTAACSMVSPSRAWTSTVWAG